MQYIILYLSLLFLILPGFLHARPETEIDQLIEKGKKHLEDQNPDSARAYFQEAFQQTHQNSIELHLESAVLLSNTFLAENEFEKSFEVLSQVMSSHDLDENAEGYYDFFKAYTSGLARMEQYESAIDAMYKLIGMTEDRTGPEDPYLIRLYSNLGIIFGNLGLMEKSKNIMRKALDLAIQIEGEQSMLAAEIYNNLGLVHKRLHNYESAMTFYMKTHDIVEHLQPQNQRVLAIIHNNIGRLYSEMGDIQKGNQYILEAINMDRSKSNPTLYSSYGLNLLETGEYGKALNRFRESAEVREKITGPDHPSLSYPVYLLGKAYSALHSYDSAMICFLKAERLEKKAEKQNSEDMSLIYTGIAELKENFGNTVEAIEFYNKALAIYFPGYVFDRPAENPDINIVDTDIPTLVDIIEAKAALYFKLYQQSENDVANLENAWANYCDVADMLINYRGMITDASARLKMAERYHAIFEKTIHTAFLLNRKNDQKKYAESAFRYMEANKAFNAFESLRLKQMEDLLPDSLSFEIDRLKAMLNLYKKRIKDQQQSDSGSDSVLNELNEKFFMVNNELNALYNRIRIDYPDYYEYVVNKDLLTIQTIQKNYLDKKTLVIEYFTGEESTYVLGISDKQIKFLDLWSKEVPEKEIGNLKSTNLTVFSNSAYRIYNDYVAPVLSYFPRKSDLIFIPDGSLSFIPFEVLVSKANEGTHSFLELDYLIKDYIISYHYSMNLFSLHSAEPDFPENEETLIAFAPSFNKLNNPLLATRSADDSARVRELDYLPHAEKEAENIVSLYNGEVRSGDEATEEFFKRAATRSNILHLATHALVDPQDPLMSKLVFAPDAESKEDGLLHVYELYAMKFNAGLVSLSACNTGIGKYYRGEGVISLAQGFLYAGVPNIMLSLWTVADFSTARIMTGFYENLKQDSPIPVALRKAKLDYLKQADSNTAAPYYWGGFIVIGNYGNAAAVPYELLLISGAIVLGLIFVFIAGRKILTG